MNDRPTRSPHALFRSLLPVLLTGLLLLLARPTVASLQTQLTTMLESADLRQTRVSVVVMDLDQSRTLAEVQGDEPMIPASNLKLVTSAAALDVLGKDYRFHTPLRLTAPDPTTGLPNLLIVGDGDPAFGEPRLMRKFEYTVEQLLGAWAQAVVDQGITELGAIVVDDRIFDRQFVHPSWPREQLNRWYCAEVAGLNFYANCIDVLPIPGAGPGEAPRLEIFPPSPFLQITNRATFGKDNAYWMSRPPTNNRMSFHGSVRQRPGSSFPMTIHDPPLYFAQLLAHTLQQHGVKVATVSRPEDDAQLPESRLIHQFNTPLSEVLRRCNADSHNLFAEALLKRIGHQQTGQPGSFLNGTAAVRAVMSERIGPLATALAPADGSGMSRESRVSARALVELLARFRHDAELGPAYRDSLAFCGRDAEGNVLAEGTFRGRFRDLKPGQFVYGKSGYISRVSTCSGYLFLPQPDGQPTRVIGFSFLFNNFPPNISNARLKDLQDAMVIAIAEAMTLQPVASR